MARSSGAAPRFADCTGALVAGGRSTRLGGIPKGLLRVGGEPIVSRSLRLFGELFAGSMIVANDPETYARFGAPVVPDAIAGKGAPGGVHAALTASPTPWVFTAACDMPFLAAEPIAWLARRRGGAVAVAVVWNGRPEPLHAFWSRDCLPELEQALRAGDPSLRSLAAAVGATFVSEEEWRAWRAVDPAGRAFANVNTHEDARALDVGLPGRAP
jgi:molybdopterin-guanine dinucleotide biosynthesis protein A